MKDGFETWSLRYFLFLFWASDNQLIKGFISSVWGEVKLILQDSDSASQSGWSNLMLACVESVWVSVPGDMWNSTGKGPEHVCPFRSVDIALDNVVHN